VYAIYYQVSHGSFNVFRVVILSRDYIISYDF
jgi:hypothetical protein